MAPRDPRSPDGVMGDPHDARSEQEYMEGKMVKKMTSAKSRGRRWQARVGYPCGGRAKDMKASKLGGGRTRVDIRDGQFGP